MAQCAASACSVEHHLMAAGPRSGLGAPGRGLAVQARGFGKLVTVHGIFRYLLEPTGSPPPPLLNALSCLAVNSPTAHKLSFALLPVASASPPTNCCLNFLCPQTTSRLPNSLAPTPLPSSSSSSQPFHPISSRRHNEPYQGAPPGPPAHDPLPRQAHRPLQDRPQPQGAPSVPLAVAARVLCQLPPEGPAAWPSEPGGQLLHRPHRRKLRCFPRPRRGGQRRLL